MARCWTKRAVCTSTIFVRRAQTETCSPTAGGTEVLEPRSTFHGFRYAEISGLSGDLTPPPRPRASCTLTPPHRFVRVLVSRSQPPLRQHRLGPTRQLHQYPDRLPSARRALGWLGDAQIFARTAAYNRDVASFFSKWLDDLSDAQLPCGAFTDFAPRLSLDQEAAPAWGTRA